MSVIPSPEDIRIQHDQWTEKMNRLRNASPRVASVSEESPSSEKPAPTKVSSKPFVLKKHLTQKPLADHEGLTALRNKLAPKKRPTNSKKENN